MFTDLTHRLRSLIRRRHVDQDLDDELRFHLDRLVDRHVAHGLGHDEAMRRALASVQVGIRPGAPSSHVVAAVIWVAVALVACYLPASRAARVDPMETLRHE